MKKLGFVFALSMLVIGTQSFTAATSSPVQQEITHDNEVTFKIKNDTGGSVRLQFKGSGGDSGTMTINSNVTTEFKKDAGCKVLDYESGKVLFEVSDDLNGTTVKLSAYM